MTSLLLMNLTQNLESDYAPMTTMNPDVMSAILNKPASRYAGERRAKERVYIPFPTTVEGVDVNGEEFKIDTVLDNLGREGLYLRMMPCVKVGSKLKIVFRLSSAATEGMRSPRVSVRGTVLRSEEKPGSVCGVAVKYSPIKFL